MGFKTSVLRVLLTALFNN